MQEVASPLKAGDPYSVNGVDMLRYANPNVQPYYHQQHTAMANVGRIEIRELKDALSYTEFLLAKSLKEKEQLV